MAARKSHGPPAVPGRRVGSVNYLHDCVAAMPTAARSAAMRQRLLAGLDQMWQGTLAARRAMNPGSPVATLDALLRREQVRAAHGRERSIKIFSQFSPRAGLERESRTVLQLWRNCP